MAGRFTVGTKFASYLEFTEELELYKKSTFAEYFIKDCRTLEAARKRLPVRVENANKALKYYFMKLMCIYGGSYKKKVTTGERNSSTMRQGCKAVIYLKLSDDGKSLVIKDMSENHNHELSQELFDFIRCQKRLPTDMQKEILEMLDLDADIKLIQHRCSSVMKKRITLRNLWNLKAKADERVSVSMSQLEELNGDYEASSTPEVVREETVFPGAYEVVEIFQVPETPQLSASTPSRNRVPLIRPDGTGTTITLENKGDRVPFVQSKKWRPNASEKAVETLARSAERRDAAWAEEREEKRREADLRRKLMEEEHVMKMAVHEAALKAEEERAAAATAKRKYYEHLLGNIAQS